MSTTYTTVQGDMWDSIAYRQLGDTRHTDVLMRANMQHHKTIVFSAGVELVIPDVAQAPTANDLPPWKRVSG